MSKSSCLSILCVLALLLGACSHRGDEASAAARMAAPASTEGHGDAWVEGKNYFVIEQAPPGTHPGKIEVTEVFSYACPACNQFRESSDAIASQLPADTVMTYLPVSFSSAEDFPLFQRSYYAADSLGVAADAHDAMFDAVWKIGTLAVIDDATGTPKPAGTLPTLDDVARFYAGYGIEPAKFISTARSPAIDARMKHADALIRAYGINALPSVIVDGRYRLDPVSAGGYPQMVRLTRWLLARAAADK